MCLSYKTYQKFLKKHYIIRCIDDALSAYLNVGIWFFCIGCYSIPN